LTRRFAFVGILVVAAAVAAILLLTAGSNEAPSGASRSGGSSGVNQSQSTEHLTVVASGDLLIHGPVFQQALQYGGNRYDFRPMFRRIAGYVRRSDLAICHVETPLRPGPPSGYPLFATPMSLAGAVKATGWEACDTASNHTLDEGQAGIDTTTKALDRAGVRHTGSYRSRAASRKLLMLNVKGVKVAFLAYSEMTNGHPLPHPWSENLARPQRILADARRARREGAQVVLVNVHWGPPEYAREPTAPQQRLVRRLARSPDITAIIGQGPHVVWPIRWLRGKPVVLSEGNLVSNQTAACCVPDAQDGIIAVLRITVHDGRARVDRADYVPVWVRHPDFTVLPVGRALRYHLAPAGDLVASYRRTVGRAGRSARTQPDPRTPP
jgi:poly-gamma-glutamate capsule biosynthesis protein CapA/YwtB (metallophosphatase superfamily)